MLLDLLVNASLGLVFALAARDRLRADGPFVTPAFLLVIIFVGFVVVPMTLYLYWAHSAWSWLYLVDPAKVPALAVVPAVAVSGGLVVAAWYVGAILIRADKTRAVAYSAAGCGLVLLVLVLIFRARLGSAGSYQDYLDGRTMALMDVKLGYALLALLLGVGASAGFVIVELMRDSRRVRAR